MAHPYHTQSDLVPGRLPERDLVQLTNDTVGATTVDTDVYEAERGKADGLVDGYLGARYAVPLDDSDVTELVKSLSIDITVYMLFRRRYTSKVPDQVQSDYEQAMKTLRDLSRGVITLGIQPAPSANSERSARLSSHTRVFTRSKLAGF